MSVLKSSIPYAKALFGLARQNNSLSEVKSDIQALLSSLRESQDFNNLISNPTISNPAKTEILSRLFETRLRRETMDFLQLLVRKRRIAQLSSVCESFIDMANKEANTVHVRLITATKVSDSTQKQIAAKTLKNVNYEIENMINPDIIGGYILEFNNKMLDQSISTKIKTIKNNLDK